MCERIDFVFYRWQPNRYSGPNVKPNRTRTGLPEGVSLRPGCVVGVSTPVLDRTHELDCGRPEG